MYSSHCIEYIVQLLTQNVTSKRDLPVFGKDFDGFCMLHLVPELGTHTLLELRVRRRRGTAAAQLRYRTGETIADVLGSFLNRLATPSQHL